MLSRPVEMGLSRHVGIGMEEIGQQVTGRQGTWSS